MYTSLAVFIRGVQPNLFIASSVAIRLDRIILSVDIWYPVKKYTVTFCMAYFLILGSLKMKTTEGGAAWGFKMRTMQLKIASGERDKILSTGGESAKVLGRQEHESYLGTKTY